MSADVISNVSKKNFNARSASDSKKLSTSDSKVLGVPSTESLALTTKRVLDTIPEIEEFRIDRFELVECEKQKGIFGSPLSTSTNLFGKVSAVPYIVEACVNHIISHVVMCGEKLLTGDSDRVLFEKLRRKFDRGDLVEFTQKTDPTTVWNLLKFYLSSLPSPILDHSIFKAFITSKDLDTMLTSYLQESKSILKRLLGLIIGIRDFIRSKSGENELIKSFSDILFKYKLDLDSLDYKVSKKDNDDYKVGLPSKRDCFMKSVVIFIIQNAERLAAFLEDQSPPILHGGEVILLRFYRVKVKHEYLTLWVTNYRIFFINPEHSTQMEIPVMSIQRIIRTPDVSSKKSTLAQCSLLTKEFATMELEFENSTICDHFLYNVKTIIHPKRYTELFAFVYSPKFDKESNLIHGWNIYNPIGEFDRQKVFDIKLYTGTKMWRITTLNNNYDILSYPISMVVPYAFNDQELKKILNVRLRNRLPILAYSYRRNKGAGVLIRCDEPDVSMIGDGKDGKLLHKQLNDTKYLERLSALSSAIHVVDCGSRKTYALSYAQFHVQFLDFESNTQIQEKRLSLLSRYEKYQSVPLDNDKVYLNWVHLIKKIFIDAYKISKYIEDKGCVILTHNLSHDMDFILTSLSQLFLDGYYRTLIGFQVLIEKDWCYYGYEFAVKVGHGSEIEDLELISPAFQLFLECVYILIQQYPLHFEFNEAFLTRILEALYSCQYGTFLGNCAKDRDVLKDKTPSLWTEMNLKPSEYTNGFYESDTFELTIVPYSDVERIVLWSAIHARTTESYDRASQRLKETPKEASIVCLENMCIHMVPYELVERRETVRQVRLAKNKIATFPLTILNLSELTYLDLSSNPLKLITSDVCYIIAHRMVHLQHLNISRTGIRILPEELGFCKSLRVLRISHNDIHHVPTAFSMLQNLEIFDARFNQIETLGSLLSAWTKLRVLAIGNNLIQELHDLDTKELELVDVSMNKLTRFPEDLARVKRLRTLYMDDNAFERLPSLLGKLSHLNTLHVSNCGLVKLPKEISMLKKLTTFYASNNQLRTISAKLLLLTNIVNLDLSHNHLNSIPEKISMLVNLESLNLSSNNINYIPTIFPITLTRLKCLKLASNNISTLDNMVGIWHMTQLEHLDLHKNPLKQIPRTLGLLGSNLRILNVSTSMITYPPPTIMKKGVLPALRYMNDQLRGNMEDRRVNILILGAKGSGRSTVTKSLLHKSSAIKIPMHSDVLEMYEWNFAVNNRRNDKEINALVWDFDYYGELETYQIVHNLYMTERGMYIVVWNTHNPIDVIDPWLNLIKSKAPKGNAIIACTFVEENPHITKSIVDELESRYKKRYAFVKKIVFSVKGWKELRSSVMNVFSDMPWLNQPKPTVFEVFEKMLTAEASRLVPPLVTWAKFKEIAQLCCIEDDAMKDNAARYLKDMGVIYFHRDNPILKDYVLLDRTYPINFIQQIMKDKNAFTEDGVLYHNRLDQMNGALFPPSSHEYLLALMEQLHFSFKIQDNRRTARQWYLQDRSTLRNVVPILLPSDPPAYVEEAWSQSSGYLFGQVHKMKHVPLSLMPLIQAKIQSFIDHVYPWEHGLYVESLETGEAIRLTTNSVRNRVALEVKSTGKCSLSRSIIEIFECARRMLNQSASVYILHYKEGLKVEEATHIPLLDVETAILLDTHVKVTETKSADPEQLAPTLSTRILGVYVIPWTDLIMDLKIGDGSTAEVFLAMYQDKKVAVKKLRVQGFVSDAHVQMTKAYSEFRREVRYMSMMKHPSILGFEGVVLNPLSIVLEYCPGGSLYDFVHYPKVPMTWDLRLKLIYDLTRGLSVMHAHNPPIVHRDLKSPNIMVVNLSEDWHEMDSIVKVSDFGLTGIIPEIGGREVDNPIWLAPEVMKRQEYTEKADVYALGVIMYEVLTSQQFFEHITFMTDLEALIISGERPEIPDIPEMYEIPEYIELMRACWEGEEHLRPTVFEIHETLYKMIRKYAPTIKVFQEDFEKSLINIDEMDIKKGNDNENMYGKDLKESSSGSSGKESKSGRESSKREGSGRESSKREGSGRESSSSSSKRERSRRESSSSSIGKESGSGREK